MKYYIIKTKEQYMCNNYGDVIGCKPSKIICIVEKEEVAKDFCKKYDCKYEEVEVEDNGKSI